MHTHRLLVLACSATKTDSPGRIPALERYNGPLWQTLRTVDPDSSLASVASLSARYGFRDVRDPIADYNMRLTPSFAQTMIAGGVDARWPASPWARSRTPRMPIGDHAGCHISRITDYGDRPVTEVALVGGHLYLEVMRTLVIGFQQMRCVTLRASVIEINGPIGRMRQELRSWLLATSSNSLPVAA